MFKEGIKHEMAIKKNYIPIHKIMGWSFKKRVAMKKNGASIIFKQPRLDRRERNCYPRGKAFLRMVDLHTAEWLQTDGRLSND